MADRYTVFKHGEIVADGACAAGDAEQNIRAAHGYEVPIDASDPHASAREIAALIERGDLTPDAMARATLARIAIDDQALGAFVCTMTDDMATRSQQLRGPLAGVPVAVKDIFDTRDLPTAYGSPIYAAKPARADAAIVSALRRAGGLVIGKSSTTEFAYLQPTKTLNPRATGRTPGGSSAGSAAAVAAGLVPLALGSQTGGSVIRPASYCGVVGYKPSFGWLPTAGLKCFSWSLDTVGLFARDVADVAWFAQTLNGRTPALGANAPWTPVVVGVPDTYPWDGLSDNARAAVALGGVLLEEAGIEVRPCRLPPWVAAASEAHAVIQGFEAWRCLCWEFEEHHALLSPLLREYLQGTRDIMPGAYQAAQAVAAQARAQAQDWLQAFDVLLTPSAPDEAPEGYATTGAASFNRPWTLLGLPCINVPGLVGIHGAPMGLQLIAPLGADARLLAVAMRMEQAIGSRLASTAIAPNST